MAALEGSVARPRAHRSIAADRSVRLLGEPRLAVLLLLATGVANVVAAIVPGGRDLLDDAWYATLLGMVALSAIAGAAVRSPSTWREWRRPGPVRPGPDARDAAIEGVRDADAVAQGLRASGYRVRVERHRSRWAVHGVRRGWSAFARHGSHLAITAIVFGVAIGAAFGSETTFSLLRADQALLDAPRPGFSSAIRLDGLDASFDATGRPLRLDVAVSFLRGGDTMKSSVIRVNEPGSFDGYQVHAWTYGPAAALRVTTLGGATLVDAAVPLDGGAGDGPAEGSIDLPTADAVLGLVLADDGGTLGVSLVDARGSRSTAALLPNQRVRVGSVFVELVGYDAWVTLMSRRDPGGGLIVAGAALLCLSLAAGLWMPRRRVSVRPSPTGLRIVLRGERFDRPAAELARLRRRLATEP
jgi:hypothetical protein